MTVSSTPEAPRPIGAVRDVTTHDEPLPVWVLVDGRHRGRERARANDGHAVLVEWRGDGGIRFYDWRHDREVEPRTID